MAEVEERFEAAVGVIQGLPKDGSFQPSNEMKLKFYAFYKQARDGPCVGARPSFWDVVARWANIFSNTFPPPAELSTMPGLILVK